MDQAEAAADSVAEQWRALYNMPPTDPRFLQATEEQMIRDLITRRIINQRNNPDESQDQDAQDPTVLAELKERKRRFLADQANKNAIRAMIGGAKDGQGLPGPKSVVLSGSFQPRRAVKP